MNLTSANVRYLLTIYKLSENENAICSTEVAKMLAVTRPSVARMMGILSDKQLITKGLYGKVRLTTEGRKIAQEYSNRCNHIELLLSSHFSLADHEAKEVAIKILCELPDGCFGKR